MVDDRAFGDLVGRACPGNKGDVAMHGVMAEVFAVKFSNP
jgi:hypothetical protein